MDDCAIIDQFGDFVNLYSARPVREIGSRKGAGLAKKNATHLRHKFSFSLVPLRHITCSENKHKKRKTAWQASRLCVKFSSVLVPEACCLMENAATIPVVLHYQHGIVLLTND